MFKVFITNRPAYIEGELIGKWVELPCDDIESELESIGCDPDDADTYFITDYEGEFYIDENESIYNLNDMAQALDNLSLQEMEIAENLISYTGQRDIEEILRLLDDVIIYEDCFEMSDIAYYLINESGCYNDLPDIATRYFDYEAFGRNLDIEGTFIQCSFGMVEVLNY